MEFRKFIGPICMMALMLTFSTYAQESGKPQTVNQLLDFVEENSPEIQKAKLNVDVTKQKMVQASQFPNPEFTLGNWKGKANSKTWSQTDYTLTQPVELGGKRGSRIDLADAEINQATVELVVMSAELRLKTIFLLYRYRQLNDEMILLKEATNTFGHLVGSYKRRPQLSPEQSTTLFNFQLAENDYELKFEDANSEFLVLGSELKILTGLEVQELLSLIPSKSNRWPELKFGEPVNSPTLRILAAQTEISEKELQLAKSDVWPTVNIGPSYTAQNQFGEQANILGVVVSFPIPVLNQNQGAKAIASKSIMATQKLYQIEKSIIEVRRESLNKIYQSSSTLLTKLFDKSDFRNRHEKVEANFLKGLISSPLVLESHRQMFENQRLYHERELKTLDVYYQIVLMEGRKVEGF